ncbi:TPM domain-containing protein [Altererythrobacter sp. CAU 1778]
MRRFLTALVGALTVLSAPLQAQDFPELSGRVVDQANIIPPEVEAQLTTRLEALETQSQRQLVVATIPDLQGYDIADYGYQLGRAWGIGDDERNDGVLLVIAPNDRKVRIEVGYGLEPVLTDGLSGLIVQNTILPRFREGDMPGGIVAGADAIITQLQLPEEEARQIAAQATQVREEKGGFPIGMVIWIAFIFFFFILPAMRGRGRRRHYGGGNAMRDIILWEAGKAIARGASGSGGGSSWGGGGFSGGFSGGGGSFGGGGASGGW